MRIILLAVSLSVTVLSCTAQAVDTNSLYHMSVEELQAMDQAALSKKEKKQWQKALKSRQEAAKMYGDLLDNGEVKFQEVIELEGATSSSIYAAAHEWLSNPDNIFRQTGIYRKKGLMQMLSVDTKTETFPAIINNYRQKATITREQEGNIVAAHIVVLDQQNTGLTNNLRSVFYEANLRVEIRENRYRVTVDDITWANWNQHTGEGMPIWPGKDHAARGCGEQGTIEQMISCPKSRKNVHKSIETFTTSLKEGLADMNAKIAKTPSTDDEVW